MSIPYKCACGESMRFHDSLVGQTVKCPSCERMVAITEKEAVPADEVLELQRCGDGARSAPLDDILDALPCDER